MAALPDAQALQSSALQDAVKALRDEHMFSLILESMLLSLYAALMGFHCIKYITSKQRVLGIFCVSLGLFTVCTSCWVIDIWTLSNDLKLVIADRLTHDVEGPPVDQALWLSNGTLLFARTASELTIFFLSDTIALWRAYAIYGRPRKLRIMFSAILGLYSVLSSLHLIFHDPTVLNSPPGYAISFAQLDRGLWRLALGAVTGSLAAFIQIFATAMIARKAFLHRQDVRKLLPTKRGSSGHSRLVAILFIVVETGIVYTIAFIFFILIDAGVFGSVAGEYWSEFWMCQTAGIYPTLIVVIVSLRASILEQSVANASELPTVSLNFASNGDHEALSAAATNENPHTGPDAGHGEVTPALPDKVDRPGPVASRSLAIV